MINLKIKKILISAFVCLGLFIIGQNIFAQDDLSVWGDPLAGKTVGLEAFSAIGMGNRNPQIIIASVVQVVLGFLGVLSVLLILYAGFLWMTASGDEEKVTNAKKLLTNAVIGLLIILSAFAIATFILRALIKSAGDGMNSGISVTDICSPEGQVSACGCGGSKICQSGKWSACVGSDCGGANKGRRFCDANILTQGVCEADNQLCDNDQFCDNKDCRCSQKGQYGDPCDADLASLGCQADNTRCGVGLTCNVDKGCICTGGPIIKAISPVGGFCQGDNNKTCATDSDCIGLSPANCDQTMPNSAVGNYVTISGLNFLDYDATVSKVYFFDGSGMNLEGQVVSTINSKCPSAQAWNDQQIIVLVPAGVQTGPIKITAVNGSDQTDDDSGYKGALLINSITRPGLCQIDPGHGKYETSINYFGTNLTNVRAYFGNYADNINADGQPFTDDDTGFAVVPNIQNGLTTSFVRQINNGSASNFLQFTKDEDDEVGPTIISFEPQTGTEGTYVTIRGLGFGAGREFDSTVYFGDTEADFVFPPECLSSIWTANQIIIKTPKGLKDKTNYLIKVKVGAQTAISNDNFVYDKAVKLAPSLCRIDPVFGQANDSISLWGEYFETKDKFSKVRFYADQDQSETGIFVWQTGSKDKADYIKTTVAKQAITGPVYVVKDQVELVGNGLNLNIGICDKDDQCGGSAVCCPAGTPAVGKCKSAADQCYGSVDSCVFEWDFVAASDNNCPSNTPNLCQDNRCCASKCMDDGSGKTVCTDDLNDRLACSGFGNSLCTDSVLCPNSPGNCSYKKDAETIGMTCDCSLLGYSGVFENINWATAYDPTTNRCVEPNRSCSPAQIIKDGAGKDSQAYCANYLNYGARWHLKTNQSCPSGFTKSAGDDSLCVNTAVDAKPCLLCPSKLNCNGDGKCVSPNIICPNNFQCLGANQAGQGAVCKRSEGLCECCCDKNKNDNNSPTKANPACCSELTCANDCGNGTGSNNEQYGSCSGCANVGTTQAEHDNACNCSGPVNSSGKFCEITTETPGGVCRDCGSIGDVTECSKHQECCVDGKNGNACSSVIDNRRLDGTLPVAGQNQAVKFCSYFSCETGCSTDLITGDYSRSDSCDKDCSDTDSPDSCAGVGNSLCLDSVLCPNSPGNCSYKKDAVATGNSCYCSVLGCTNQNGTGDCVFKNNSCFSDRQCQILAPINFNNQELKPYCAAYKDKSGQIDGDYWQIKANGTCPPPYVSVTSGSNLCVDLSATCEKCPSQLSCLLDEAGQPFCGRQAICPSNFTCENAGTAQAVCSRKEGLCECCCDKNQNNQASPTKANPACCNGLTCANICGSGTGSNNEQYGSCSGCADVGSTQAEHDSACNCDASSGKYCDMTDAAKTGGVCSDCSSIGSAVECSNHSACCFDSKTGSCTAVSNGGTRLTGPVAFCGYFSCLTDNCQTAKEYSPDLTASMQFKTKASCSAKCNNNSCDSDGLNDAKCSKPDNIACQIKLNDLSAVCNIDTCQCEKKSLVDQPCLGASGGSCAKWCGEEYTCRGDKGCIGPACATDLEQEKTCNCCCDPKVSGTVKDKCMKLGDGLTNIVTCVADQGNCTGEFRGLCCGCKKDSDCQAVTEKDASLNGCAKDGCCKPRARVTNYGPRNDNICRNSLIWADFDRPIDTSSLNNNLILLGNYGAGQCPEGTTLLAYNNKSSQPNRWYAQIWRAITNWFVRINPFVPADVSAGPTGADNFCLIQSKARAIDIDLQTGKASKVLVEAQVVLGPNVTHYVVLKGDEMLDSSTGIKDINNIGFKGQNNTLPKIFVFNGIKYDNAQIWQFTTNNKICPIDSVVVTPAQKLFTENNQVENFSAEARSSDGQPLNSTSVYSFSWEPWYVEVADLVSLENLPAINSQTSVKVTSGAKVDGQTLLKATARIDYDSLSAVATTGQTKVGQAKLIFFYCKNPWPPIINVNTWPLGWWDDKDNNPSAHCDVGVDADCFYNDFQIYYCRDQAQTGTADDLPALASDPTVRARYLFGVGGQATEVLKDIYFFREAKPVATSSLEILNDKTSQLGGAVIAKFGAVGDFNYYKVYYGQNPGAYNNYVLVERKNKAKELSTVIKPFINDRKYYFSVTTISDLGVESAFSPELVFEVRDETAPLARAGKTGQMPIINLMKVDLSDPNNKKIIISWVKDNNDVKDYYLEYGPNADPAVSLKLGLVNSYTINNLNNLESQGYYIHLRAFDKAGNSSAYNNYYCGKDAQGIVNCQAI